MEMEIDIGMEIPKIEEKSEEIIVLDIETTDFLENGGHIVEIGMVLLNIKTGNIKKLFDKVICPGPGIQFKQSAWIFQNSDLKIEEVMKSNFLDLYRKEIQSLLNKYPVTAFNKKFDIGFLKKSGFKIPKEISCIMLELTPVMAIPHSYYGVKYPNVEEAWKFYFPNIPYSEKHRAYDDAVHESKILYQMIVNNHYHFKDNCSDCKRNKPCEYFPKDATRIITCIWKNNLTQLEQLELDRFYVSLGMRKQAGGFFKGIGIALGSSHPSNTKVVRDTWLKEWNEFLEIGKILHEKENEIKSQE